MDTFIPHSLNRRSLGFGWLIGAVATLVLVLFASTATAKPPHPKPDPLAPSLESAPSAEPKPLEPPKEFPRPDDDDALPPPHPPVTMKVGIALRELNKFDLNTGAYNAEFDVSIACESEPCKPDLDVANGKIQGKPEKLKDEPLRKEYRIKAELGAELDLSRYPFDNHLLPITLQDKGDPEQIVYALEPSEMSIANDIKLPGWDLVAWLATTEKDEAGVSQVHFFVEAKRPRMMAFFKTCLPVVVMMFVAAFTLLLKPKSASGRLTAATAALMSLVLFHVAQVTSLPPQASLTTFDRFMVATYFAYLINIALTVMMVRFEEKKAERMSELMYLVALGAVPGFALLAWTFALV
jgi:hypothetical protein